MDINRNDSRFYTGINIELLCKESIHKDIILINNVFYLGGNGFIKLMKMLVVPLVFFSIVVGTASISDINKIGKIGGRTIIIYLITTALAITISSMMAMIIKPGVGLNMMNITANTTVTTNVTMTDTILNIIPDNPINSLANGDMYP